MKFFLQSGLVLAALIALMGNAFAQNISMQPPAGGRVDLMAPAPSTTDTVFNILPNKNIHIKSDVSAGRVIINAKQVSMTDTDTDLDCGGSYPRLAVSGDVRVSGNIAVGGIMTCSSDRRFKKNIQVLPNTLNKVMQLQGVSYEWRAEEFPSRNFGAGTQIGLIAQDVEALFPDLVTTDGSGYKSVNYIGLVPVLIEAIKAQQAQIEGLQQQAKVAETATARLNALEARLNAMTAEQPAEAPAAGRR